jgi:hypothetical protein
MRVELADVEHAAAHVQEACEHACGWDLLGLRIQSPGSLEVALGMVALADVSMQGRAHVRHAGLPLRFEPRRVTLGLRSQTRELIEIAQLTPGGELLGGAQWRWLEAAQTRTVAQQREHQEPAKNRAPRRAEALHRA